MKKKTMTILALALCTTAAAQDSTMLKWEKWLDNVVVAAKRPLYRTRADVMVYDVSADSSMVGKTSFDALRNTPMLITERSGTVRSVNGMDIEYLVNGKHDNALSGNIHDAAESLETKHLKRIEVRIERGVDGTERLQVNFVTKGRLIGYRGTANSTLTDESWRNGAFVFAKRGRWGLAAWYTNTWRWGHGSTSETYEWRYNQSDLHHITRSTNEGSYKTDLNNLEVDLNYEFSPLSVLSFYGRALLKANPHSDATTAVTATNSASALAYRYTQDRHFTVGKDAEYTFSAAYEKLFGENVERGKFYAGYEFYRRPIEATTDENYTELSAASPEYVQDFFNMTERSRSTEDWHTANILYRRKTNGHEVFAEEFLRYRDECEATSQLQRYDYAATPHEAEDWSDYTHRQLANMLKAGYGYASKRFQARAGGTYTYMHDYSRRKETDDAFSADRQFFTPWADVTVLPTWKSNLRLSYTMSRQVPDIAALNLYIHTNVPGQITYGNPALKPQTTHSLSLSSNIRAGRVNIYAEAANNFASDLILRHSFLEGGILNITKDNMGRRYDFRFQSNASSKLTRTTWGRIDASISYTDYAATQHYASNRGCTFTLGAQLQQELPCRFDLSASGGFNTPWVYLQGRGGRNYHYSLRLDKTFPRQRLTIGAEARSFIPIHYTRHSESRSEGYFSETRDRTYHASFALSLRWRFGKLKAEERKVEEEIEHNDIKRSYDE